MPCPVISSSSILRGSVFAFLSVAHMKESVASTVEPQTRVAFLDVNMKERLVLLGVACVNVSTAFAIYVKPSIRKAIKQCTNDEVFQEVLYDRVLKGVEIKTIKQMSGDELVVVLKGLIGWDTLSTKTRTNANAVAFFGQFHGLSLPAKTTIIFRFEYPESQCRTQTDVQGRVLTFESEILGKSLLQGFLGNIGLRTNFEQRRETFLREAKWMYTSHVVMVHYIILMRNEEMVYHLRPLSAKDEFNSLRPSTLHLICAPIQM
jgi:hypothetical protein